MIAAIVQARMGSTRLPGKVLLPLAGKPVIRHVIERAVRITGIGVVVCAVPETAENDGLAAEAAKAGAHVYRGSEHDVLDRYYGAAVEAGAGIIVRITADCPLIDPQICGRVVELLIDSGLDYASNVNPRGYPKGLDCEAFTFDALRKAHVNATDPYDREHVCPWMQRHTRLANLPGNRSREAPVVLDTPEDYRRLRTIMEGQ